MTVSQLSVQLVAVSVFKRERINVSMKIKKGLFPRGGNDKTGRRRNELYKLANRECGHQAR